MEKEKAKKALYISAGFIVLVWTFKLVRNTFFIDSVLSLFDSLPRVFVQSFITAVLVIFSVTLLLRYSRERYSDIGFNKENLSKQIRTGCLFGAAIFVLDTFIVTPLLGALIPETSVKGIDMGKLFDNTGYIIVFLFIGIFKGGFSEELWRIFALTRFEKIFGRKGLIFALILGSLIFGAGHLYQGLNGMISISLIGFMYALVYLRKRSALEAVTAHSTENIISIILGYIVYARH